jgi:hypothetical protein
MTAVRGGLSEPSGTGRNNERPSPNSTTGRRDLGQSFKNQIGDRTGEAFGSRFTGWTAGSNRFDVGFLVVK